MVTPGGGTIPGGGTARGIVYAWKTSNDQISHMYARAVWKHNPNGNSKAADGALALIMSALNSPTDPTAIHVTFDRANICNIGYWEGSNLINTVSKRLIDSVQPNDGTTIVNYEVIFDRLTGTVTAIINGSSVSTTDTHYVGGAHAGYELYAPATNGLQPPNLPAFTYVSYGTNNHFFDEH